MPPQIGIQGQPSLADQLLYAIEAEECRRSLKTFLKAVWHIVEPKEFVDGWAIDCVCEHLTATTNGEIKRLLINIPPRHTKSTLVSVVWPIWTWLQSPSEQFLCASFNLGLSVRDNAKKRRIIEDPWFQERFGGLFQLSGDQNVKSFFTNTHNGHMMAISVSGATTGQGGSYLVGDDMHNADEAYSEMERLNALNWFREVWTNRLNDQKRDKMVVTGQRIHENDISGYILRERPDWCSLILPAYYEPARHCTTVIGWSDPRREEDELLWPERFSKEALEGLKRDLGSTGFASQYQQTPVPAGGGQFKREWFRYFEVWGDFYRLHRPEGIKIVAKSACTIFAVNDPAISEKQEADYTVIQIWAMTPDTELLLLAQIRAHLDNPEQVHVIEQSHTRWHWLFIAVETVFYALALYQQLKKKGIPVQKYEPVLRGDKVARASMAAIKLEAGDMYFEVGADYLPDVEGELLKFPRGGHDDITDCCSMAADLATMGYRASTLMDELEARRAAHEKIRKQMAETYW